MHEVMKLVVERAAQGQEAEQIAEELEIGVTWVRMVMRTDGFAHLVRVEQDAQAQG